MDSEREILDLLLEYNPNKNDEEVEKNIKNLTNFEYNFGRSALHLAVLSGNLKAVEFLLRHYSDIGYLSILKKTDINGETPLFLAIDKGQIEMVELFLTPNRSPFELSSFELSSFELSSFDSKEVEGVEGIEEPDMELKNVHGYTALSSAISRNSLHSLGYVCGMLGCRLFDTKNEYNENFGKIVDILVKYCYDKGVLDKVRCTSDCIGSFENNRELNERLDKFLKVPHGYNVKAAF